MLGLTSAAVALFAWQERSSSRPVVPALRHPGSLGAGAVIASGLTGTAVVSVQAYLPLFLQAGLGAPVIVAGGILATGSVVWTVGSMISARLIGHGTRWLLAAGHLSFVLGALTLIGSVALHLGLAGFYAGYMIAGLGIGLLTPSLFTIALRETARGSEGSSTASVQALRALGAGLGAGVAGLVFRLSVPHQLFDMLSSANPAAAIRDQGLIGFMDAALIACWMAALTAIALSAIVVLRLPGVRPHEAPAVEMAV